MSIHKEASRSLVADDAFLSRLRQKLFRGHISDLEFAKSVLRHHGHDLGNGRPVGFLKKNRDGDLKLTSQWIEANMPLAQRVENVIRRLGNFRYAFDFTRWIAQQPSETLRQALPYSSLEDGTPIGATLQHLRFLLTPGQTALYPVFVTEDNPRSFTREEKPETEEEFNHGIETALEKLEEVAGGYESLYEMYQAEQEGSSEEQP